jgi:cell division inhibitor SulA
MVVPAVRDLCLDWTKDMSEEERKALLRAAKQKGGAQ